MYRSEKPDIALMDVTMPHKDGLEALSEIRELDPQAKVVMLTALDQQTVMVQAMRLGAKDFLTKPVVPDRLVATLEKVLG
jgi:two-component system chemotaxis response regulator CheY